MENKNKYIIITTITTIFIIIGIISFFYFNNNEKLILVGEENITLDLDYMKQTIYHYNIEKNDNLSITVGKFILLNKSKIEEYETEIYKNYLTFENNIDDTLLISTMEDRIGYFTKNSSFIVIVFKKNGQIISESQNILAYENLIKNIINIYPINVEYKNKIGIMDLRYEDFKKEMTENRIRDYNSIKNKNNITINNITVNLTYDGNITLKPLSNDYKTISNISILDEYWINTSCIYNDSIIVVSNITKIYPINNCNLSKNNSYFISFIDIIENRIYNELIFIS